MMNREIKLLYLLALVVCAALCVVNLSGCASAPVPVGTTASAPTVVPAQVNSVVVQGSPAQQAALADQQQQIQANIAAEQTASNFAEGAWLVLDALDTMQTVQIARHPCYSEADPIARLMYGGTEHPKVGVVIGVNLALAFAHTLASSWLDDEVAKHEQADPQGTLGGWYVARIAFHAVSLLGTGASVVHNYSIGITPTGTRIDCHD